MSFIKEFFSLFKNVLHRFMNVRIGVKMVVGYIVVILIPTIIYSVNFYIQISDNAVTRYMFDKNQLMEQSYSVFKGKILQQEALYQLFQYNTAVVNFVSGYYTSEVEEVYAYIKDIEPLFSYVRASNKIMRDIRIYKYKKSLINLEYDILNIEQYHGDVDLIKNKQLYNGVWNFNENNDINIMNYRKLFYSKDFCTEAGFLEISLNTIDFLDVFNPVNRNELLLFNYENEWFVIQDKSMKKIDEDIELDADSQLILKDFLDCELSLANTKSQLKNKMLINSIYLDELNTRVIVITPRAVVVSKKNYTTLIYLAVLLLTLTIIYYVLISSITRRLVKLSKHIGRVDYDHLLKFEDEDYRDEMGILTKSYNKMITRISALMDSVNIAELKKKEADFHALQAQIKPHFIYNSLETIRMMAEVNDDSAVADITYNLGRFLRYNMSWKKEETLLKNEVDNIKNYLSIYKVSMGDRLEFNINIKRDISYIKCPSFILQPLVENSLHHGLTKLRDKYVLEVEIYEYDEYVIITVSDNGAGIKEGKLKIIQEVLDGKADSSKLSTRGNGIGIVNVNERIKSYFGEESGLFFYSRYNYGTTCEVRFKKHGGLFGNADNDSGR